MTDRKHLLGFVLCWLLLTLSCRAALPDLATSFNKPPDSARPWVYWFWLNGNITRQGITADLEAMKRVGIGGVLIMEVDQGAPLGPVPFMSDQWRDLFKHVAAEAQRLGLEVNMNNDAGWNGSGGPWIKPEQSMQEVAWSETEIAGPQRFEGALAQPRAVAGYYRDIAVMAFPNAGGYRLPGYETKAAFQRRSQARGPSTQPALKVIERGSIINLNSHMDATGRLSWDVPAGQWTVLRLGHTSTGMQNTPAPASGRGLECDKLSPEGIEANFAGMMAKLAADVGPALSKSLVATHIDSWENGSQNWTGRMREEFRKRRGYDIEPYLPAMTGRVVGSVEVTERFLWDLRRTISELVVENYAGRMRQLANEHGMRFTCEAYGSPCDFLPYAGQADEPMGEFWMGGNYLDSCRGMASAGHTYGKPIIGAESFTAGDTERWIEHPASIKSLGDRAFCEGINRFVFHRYALQPWPEERVPGMTMGPWGLHYERTQTWWEWSRPWHEYLARCQFMLRQGSFVADVCYLQAEAPPQKYQMHNRAGYDWDECPAEVVLTRMRVENGRLVLPDGMSYRLLVLPDSRTMTPELLKKISQLVEAGATVIGTPPVRSPSLAAYPQCDAEVSKIAAQLWGDGSVAGERRVGKGRVLRDVSPEKTLAQDGVPADFSSGAKLRYIHRAANGLDIYFVANGEPFAVTAAGAFRVRGKVPELWWPETGRVERAAVYEEKDGLTHVLLPLGPSGSVFVIFRDKTAEVDSIVSCSHEGESVFSAEAPKPQPIIVQRAVYGIPGDPQRSRDVRASVQRRVDGGETSFVVSQIAEGDDPARNVTKTLVVEYAIGSAHFTVQAQDRDTIRISPEAVKIVVTKAQYGVLTDAQRTRDVRAKVQRLADAGETTFQVARMAQGDDPAYGIVKTLVLEYTRDGKPFAVRTIDREMVDLSPTASEPDRPAAVLRDADGRRVFQAWQPGRYELKHASGLRRQVDVLGPLSPLEVSGPWQLAFPPNSGAPATLTLDKPISWSQHPAAGVKYFSGTATYTRTLTVPTEMLGKARRLYLDLGNVQVMAQVKLNGKDQGLLWKPPYRLDITDAAKPGENSLEVKVVNLWPNRLIGDEQLPEDSDRNANGTLKKWPDWLQQGKPSPTGRLTFTSWRLWKKDSPLLESGLIGPVMLRAAAILAIE